MSNFFSFRFHLNGITFNAEAEADTGYYPVCYHVRTGDLTFDIFPKEAADGSIVWVDEEGDSMALLQSVGDAIAEYESGH